MAESDADAQGPQGSPELRRFVYGLFFVFGGITSLNDVIIPKFKELFTLSYAEAMLVQSAFFAAYFLFAMPGAAIVLRIGYMRTAVVGLGAMATGCLLFVPASLLAQFPIFLLALFVLAAGITLVQVVVNPLILALGPPALAHSRLTFAEGYNSLGTTVFPFFGSMLILGALSNVDQKSLSAAALLAYRAQETRVIMQAYIGLAAGLAALAGIVWLLRHRLIETKQRKSSLSEALTMLRQPRFGVGALCIFLYVGAEVAIGSVIVNYLMQADVMAASLKTAGAYVPVYWGGAMIGRFIGAALLRVVRPGQLLAVAAMITIALLLVSANTTGDISGWSLLAIGLFNSIMFPTIFALASEGLGIRAAEGSGIIASSIVGGAVVPLVMGVLADASNLKTALVAPAICYAVIAAYGLYTRRTFPVAIAIVH